VQYDFLTIIRIFHRQVMIRTLRAALTALLTLTSRAPAALDGQRRSKQALFMIILAVSGGIAGGISLLVHFAVIRPAEHEVLVGLVAPLSGPQKALGEELRRGATLFVDEANRHGGLNGRPLTLMTWDDGDDPALAREAAEKAAAAGVVGVVGHWSAPAAAAAATVYAERGVPAVLSAPDDTLAAGGSESQTTAPGANPWVFRTSFDRTYEIRFLANYLRNVMGEKAVSVIAQAGAENEALSRAFDEVMQRFGTRVVYRWEFDSAPATADTQLKAIAAEIKEKKLIGSFLVLADAAGSAKALAALRREGIANRVAGPRILATNAFQDALKAEWQVAGRPGTGRRPPPSFASVLNGVVTTEPLLFDTAGELAQGFKAAYQKAHSTAPDWVAASAYDALRLLVYAHGKHAVGDTEPPLDVDRSQERERLAALNGSRTRLEGLFGPVAFDSRGVSAPQPLVGTYDGADLVAALTQLSPIREENVGNYLDELVAGRALYVNDRFMYKTNVVYAGLKVEKIAGLDLTANTVTLDFVMWFRWRGGVEPQDVVFVNAAEPIHLDRPEREAQVGDMTYRAYRAHGKFFLNYSSVERAYGSQIAGISFHHRTLNRNNLMYVSDVLGMDLNTGSTLADQLLRSSLVFAPSSSAEGDGGLISSLIHLVSPGSGLADPLLQAMTRGHVLAGVAGWILDRAWISQDVSFRGAQGDPAFVGFGKPQPEFSLLDMGCLLKPDQFDTRDVIPANWFVIIAIFALVGSVVASLLDRKDRGQFWRMQTMGLRIVAWPLLLMSLGSLALDYGLLNFTTSTVDTMVVVYSTLWWLVPARLAAISLERFVWVPLEIRTGRKIPNIIRMISALVIYLFAIFGVVAFVMGKTVTSLLATSGLMAMVIGLAIQANIANVFSGIVLNIERPFSVGDFIKLNAGVMGQVVDITWRTIRIRHLEGQLVCLANSKVSEAEVHNYSDMGDNFVRLQLFVDANHDPNLVNKAITDALATFDLFIKHESMYFRPDAQFKGVECNNGVWVGRYRVKFYLKKGTDENVAVHQIWARIWEYLQANGIQWHQRGEGLPMLTALPAIA
jgi:ABC-type branched-subunit amino acid transport system substrate-binding protein/small-conductance mechanosensitive channel